MVESKSEYYVCADLSGMKIAVKAPEFNGVVTIEEAMKIEEMVSAIVVVMPSALGISGIPNILNFSHSLRLLLIDLFDQIVVHLLAVPRSSRLNLQSLIE